MGAGVVQQQIGLRPAGVGSLDSSVIRPNGSSRARYVPSSGGRVCQRRSRLLPLCTSDPPSQ